MLLDLPLRLREAAGADFLSKLSPTERARLEERVSALVSLLAPLGRVRTPEDLQALLHSIAPQYLVELTAFIRECLEERLDALLMLQEASASMKGLQEEARVKADLFGNESLERFLGALESFQAFSEMVVRAVAQGGPDIQRLLSIEAAAGQELLRAAVCIMAVTEVLRENVRGWRRESLSLLAAAADDAMTEVEDAAMALTLKPPSGDEEARPVPWGEVRHELSL
jgi:hypothetical protein